MILQLVVSIVSNPVSKIGKFQAWSASFFFATIFMACVLSSVTSQAGKDLATYKTVIHRGALLAHSRPTMFYIPLVTWVLYFASWGVLSVVCTSFRKYSFNPQTLHTLICAGGISKRKHGRKNKDGTRTLRYSSLEVSYF